ncbi:MAG: substrate-binding domain-containing protein [Acidobacteriaceae bacterium]
MRFQLRRMARPLVAAALGGSCGCLAALMPALREPPAAPTIAFIPRTTGTNFMEDMRRGAEAAASAAGYRIYWNGPTREDDLDRQIRIAENAVQHGAQAVILGPTNIWGVTTMVNGFTRRHLPVVFVQTGPAEPTGPYLTSITPNQEEFGKIAAARAALVMHGSGEAAIVGIDRGTPETLSRADSFLRAIAAWPGIRVVAETPGAVQIMEAEQSTRELVSSYPQLRAIFAASADATQGAMLALQDTDAQRKISLIGSDRDLFLAVSLQEGKLDSLVTADGYKMGYLAAQAALAGIRGQPLPPPSQVSVQLLTRESSALNGSE